MNTVREATPAHTHHLPGWIRQNAVLLIAAVAAVISSALVPPDAAYAGYFDLKTLSCLFCTLAVVCALKNIHFFTILAEKIVRMTGNTRAAVTALVFITFIGSMLIANDMALITFLPLGYYVLTSTGREKYMAFTFIMQNIAANLGGMLTPFGNPQNLYLYTRFSIPAGEFMHIMLIPFLTALALIILCCLRLPKEALVIRENTHAPLNTRRCALYLVLFALSILIVFRLFPYWVGLVIIPAALLFCDRKALKQVDYGLLLTFVAFFIFSGNMARLDGVRAFFTTLLQKNPLIVSVLSCQVISNVPTAVLLSQFTANYPALLVGVNIGGAGTLIASLASLITFREYMSHNPGRAKSYILLFSALNFGFLFILTLVSASFLHLF